MKAGNSCIIIIALFLSFLPLSLAASPAPESGKYLAVKAGKEALDQGESSRAIEQLTEALKTAPIIGDYLLLWRSQAHAKQGEQGEAVADLREIREKYPQSPLLRDARKKELKIAAEAGDRLNKETERLFASYLKDYPSDFSIKFLYASLLKRLGRKEKARPLFIEIYRSSPSFSSRAAEELLPSDISAKDILARGDSLNKAWLFAAAEKSFRKGLKRLKKKSSLREKALSGLAYSLFRQKKYREAAELYKNLNLPYWRARSLLRAGDMETFEKELPAFLKSSDKRMAAVLIAHGTTKRRKGDVEAALSVYDEVIAAFPSRREDALWAKGWTSYLTGRYDKAIEILAQLYEATGDSRYRYWTERCREALGESSHEGENTGEIAYRNFYGYLSLLRASSPITAEELREAASSEEVAIEGLSERAAILAEAGLKKEAAAELLRLSGKNSGTGKLALISSALRSLGNYKQSIRIAAKMPYSKEFHELFYPRAFPAAVAEASQRSGLDPFLILSVIREESRFDPEARSIAGALGLMQLMPQTAQRVARGIPGIPSDDLTVPETNVIIGAQYLRHLIETFGSLPPAIASYNAGERAVKGWLQKGAYSTVDEFIEDIPYDETRNYVKKVMTSYFEYMNWRGLKGFSSSQISLGNL